MDQQNIQQGAPGMAPPMGAGAPAPMEAAPAEMAPMPTPGGEMAPVPGSPEMGMAPGEELVSEEQKQELLSLINDIRQRMGSLSSGRFASENTNEEVRRTTLQSAFDILRGAGVDLSDPSSIVDFIERLRMQNPEIAQDFEDAMAMLLDGYTPSNPNVDVSDLMGGAPAPAGDMGAMGADMGAMGGDMGAMGGAPLNNETLNGTEALSENMGGPAPQGPLGEIG